MSPPQHFCQCCLSNEGGVLPPSQTYITDKVFAVARQLPWGLVRGQYRGNLSSLQAGPCPTEV
eukprot:10160451-Prorocentrum_lima.AAC.1